MQLKVPLNQGYLADVYTNKVSATRNKQPIVFFPIEIQAIPQNTKFLAVSLIDYDAVPRTGFPFIHWLATDIPIMTKIPTDFSRHFEGPQGQTSWMSRFYQLNDSYFKNHYAGPNPPEQSHDYTLTLFALEERLGLADSFYYNDFLKALTGNVLTQASSQISVKSSLD